MKARKTFPVIFLSGWLLAIFEVVLLFTWFVWALVEANKSDSKHAEEMLLEYTLTAPHFGVLLSIFALHNELEKTCSANFCENVKASYTWIFPPLIAVLYDIIGIMRSYLFFHDSTLEALSITTLISSVLVFVWALVIVAKLHGFSSR